jgi:hypothetical protein
MRKYPNNITFAWERSDGDYEIVGTLNGETIENDILWDLLVGQTLITLRLSDQATQAYNREDVVSVLVPDGDEVWTPILID